MRVAGAPSWEVVILNFDGHAPIPLSEIKPGHGPRPMGSGAAVRRAVDEALADVDWSHPGHATLEDGEAWLELEVDLAAPSIDAFVVRLGGGDLADAASLVAHLCQIQGWAVLDRARGAYLDIDDPAGWVAGAAPVARS
jgi:hypothetical protein